MKRVLSALLASCSLGITAASAQEASEWEHHFTLYFIGAGLSGEVGMAGQTAEIDLGFGGILENLDFGFMGNYRMQKMDWSLGADVIYMGLGTSGEQGRAELDVDQWLVEMNGGYALRPFFTLIAGARYNSLSNRLFFPASENEFKDTQDWIDPIVGGRFSWRLGPEWVTHLRGDVGGFGLGSNFAWQVMPVLEWAPSERLSALVGYRVIGIDYENEDDGFTYDMTVSGPGLGLTAHF